MNTIYVLIKDGSLVEVAPSFNPDDALKHFTWCSTGQFSPGGAVAGEMYAVRCSDGVASEIRALTLNNDKASREKALKLAKSRSYSLTKCADIT